MRRYPATFLVVLIVLALALTGCSTGSPTPRPAPEPAPGTTPAPSPTPAPKPSPVAPPAAGAKAVPAGTEPGAPTAGNLQISPISPGVGEKTTVDTGKVQIRAVVEIDTSVDITGVGVWLDERAVAREVLEWDFGGSDRKRFVIRATPDLLKDGAHSVRLAVKAGTAAAQERRWSFTVAQPGATTALQDATVLSLYFADSPLVVAGFTAETGYVTRVQRAVPKTQRPALRAVEELIAGPAQGDGEVDRTLPAGTKVLGVTIKDRVAYVNLDESFQSLHPGGTTGGAITAQSLIMTLTEFPTVDRVQVLVAGQPWCDGHSVWEEPVPRLRFEPKHVQIPVIR